MSKVFFDTNIFIYFFEEHPTFGPEVGRLLARMKARADVLVTSTLTLGELLVKPKESGNAVLAATYQTALNSSGVQLVPFDAQAATIYADIRSDRSIKGPDAIQLACASAVQCDLFLTNDEHLWKKNLPGIQFVVPLDRVPF